MAVKKTHTTASDEINTESHETKIEQKTPKKDLNTTPKKKGYIDQCLDNPGFPWMMISILFTLLVIMFWRDQYMGYKMWKMKSGNYFYKDSRMMDDSFGPRERGMRYTREKIENIPSIKSPQAVEAPVIPAP